MHPPPSTPAPQGLRGRKLDDELCAIEPSRRPLPRDWEDTGPPTWRDPMAELVAAEAFLRESTPSSDPGPMTMRGDDLAIALEHAMSSRVRVKH